MLLVLAPRLGRGPIWTTIVAAIVAFALLPPLLSHDIYSYLDYARLAVVHGLDPYVDPPAAAPSDPAFAGVTWIATTSAYGPLFTLLTFPLAWLPVGVATLALKALAGLSVLALSVLCARVAPGRGVEPLRAAAFVGLNPLVLVHVVGGGHNDGLAMAMAMGAVAALLYGREASAGATLVAAVAVKASTAVIAPFALLGARPTGRFRPLFGRNRPVGRLVVGALLAGAAIAVAAYLAFGWSWLHAFGLAGENQGRTSHLSLPVTAARLTGLPAGAVRAAALVLWAAATAWLLGATWRGRIEWVRASAWATLALLLASAWLLPWYLIWLLPLAAICRDRPLQVLTLALTAYQLGARIPL